MHCKMANITLSEYCLSFLSVSRARYIEKIYICGLDCDPYCIKVSYWDKTSENLPKLSSTDVMLFMIAWATPSPYTKEAIKVTHFKPVMMTDHPIHA